MEETKNEVVLDGLEELLSAFSPEWFDSQVHGRGSVYDFIASVVRWLAYNALSPMPASYVPEHEANRLFETFAVRYGWSDVQKQIARATLAKNILERRIEELLLRLS